MDHFVPASRTYVREQLANNNYHPLSLAIQKHCNSSPLYSRGLLYTFQNKRTPSVRVYGHYFFPRSTSHFAPEHPQHSSHPVHLLSNDRVPTSRRDFAIARENSQGSIGGYGSALQTNYCSDPTHLAFTKASGKCVTSV